MERCCRRSKVGAAGPVVGVCGAVVVERGRFNVSGRLDSSEDGTVIVVK